MTNLLDIARMGRTSALARIGGLGQGSTAAAGASGRGRSAGGNAAVTFTSVRGRR